ncbi:hypothetical protein HHE02_02130 [Helicobacter heilmannii]|nr:hypothetical protein HHE02_02130 [Helicobacter heilmannii]CRF50718.1 hypothetical protein HHE06_05620 [Helicobacter heilmannii]
MLFYNRILFYRLKSEYTAMFFPMFFALFLKIFDQLIHI